MNFILQFIKSRLSLILILLMVIQFGYTQENLLPNGDFENGTVGWNVWGANLTTTTDAHSGNAAAIVSNRHNPWDAIAIDLKNIIENGKTYKLSAWVKIPDPAVNFRATIQLNVDGDLSYHNFLWDNNPVIGSYAYYTETFTLDWIGNLLGANLYFENESVNDIYSDYIIDDVQLIESASIIDILQQGDGWKDIKSSMLVGGCVTEGGKNYFTNAAAKAQVLKDCNTVTIQCYPAWGRWDDKNRHVYHVDEFTNRVKEMKQQNMTVTAHMLLGWDQYFPEWYKTGDFEPDTLEAIMQSWLKGIISYEGNDTLVDIWNVVNVAICGDGKGGYWPLFSDNFNDACELQRLGFEPDASGLTGSQFVNAEHPVYIRKAFEYARTLTNKKLELRDSGFEFPGSAKYNAIYQLAVHLKKMNAPVDVIGFQTHLDLEKNYDWEGYTNNIKRYRALGYEVIIPEVDIGDVNKDWTEEKAELQKRQYYKLITAAIRGGASDFQTWGFIDDGWRPDQKAFPYTNNFEAKPAYFGIKEALIDMSSILFWEMNSVVNDTMPDVMKYNNIGILNNFNTPGFVTGFKKNALQFDGVDDYITSGFLSDSIPGDLTFCFFLNTATSKHGIIADLSVGDDTGLKVTINDEGKIVLFAAGTGLAEELVSPEPVNDGIWHFVAIRRDSTTYSLYVDDFAPVATGEGTIQNYNKLTIGAKNNNTENFEGTIDEVKLYNWAIEEESFKRNYNLGNEMTLEYEYSRMRVKLDWTNNGIENVGYIIERKIGDGKWEVAAERSSGIFHYVESLEFYDTTYTYRVRSASKFMNASSSNTVNFLTPNNPNTGISKFKSESILIAPNPTHGNLNFLGLGPNITTVDIFDLSGIKLRTEKINSSSPNIDISNFRQGVYLIRSGDFLQKIVLLR